MSEGAALPLRTLIAYALPALPLALLTLPFYVLVPPYYASNLGLGLASVGTALLAVRIVDALSDPLIGTVADRWRPRFGRRRLWFALASIPTAVAAALVLMPPEHAGLGWLLAFGTLLSIASTAAIIPYYAWGAELSTDYAMRSKITGWRESFAVVGTLIALSAQAIVPAMGFAGEGNVLAALALFTLLVLPATAACTRFFACLSRWTRPVRGSIFGPGFRRCGATGRFCACWPPSSSTAAPMVCRRRFFCFMCRTGSVLLGRSGLC